jgi:hypothetical protein
MKSKSFRGNSELLTKRLPFFRKGKQRGNFALESWLNPLEFAFREFRAFDLICVYLRPSADKKGFDYLP